MKPQEQSGEPVRWSSLFCFVWVPLFFFLFMDLNWRLVELSTAQSPTLMAANLSVLIVIGLAFLLPISLILWLLEKLLNKHLKTYRRGLAGHVFATLGTVYVTLNYFKFYLSDGSMEHMRPVVRTLGIVGAILILLYAWTMLRQTGPCDLFPSWYPPLVFGLSSLALMISLGLIVVGPESSAIHDKKVSQPHIFWITADGLTRRRMSTFGYSRETTPNLSKWSQECLTFPNAITNCDFTRYSLKTFQGRYPKLGTPSGPTFGEALENAGYRSRYFLSHAFYDPVFRSSFTNYEVFDRGKDRALYQWFGARFPEWSLVWLQRLMAEDIRFYDFSCLVHPRELVRMFRDEVSPRPLLERSLEVLKSAEEPTFVWVHLFQPHSPYRPESEFTYEFGDATEEDKYDSVVRDLDQRMGEVLDQLRESRLYDNTLIVFSSDHGEAFDEDYVGVRNTGHGFWLTPSVIDIPLFIDPPGPTEPKRVATTAAPVDVAPTVLDLLGAEVPNWMEGESLVPYIENGHLSQQVRMVLSGSYFRRRDTASRQIVPSWGKPNEELMAAFKGEYKLVWLQSYKPGGDNSSPGTEMERLALYGLFNWVDDPGEQNNLLQSSEASGNSETNRVKVEGRVKQILSEIMGSPLVQRFLKPPE